MDLTDEVTVFVATVGDKPNYWHCMENLRRQDCEFRQIVIDHVMPAAKALQTMIDICETPYYVQVDEDMILNPRAVRTLYESIVNGPAIAPCWCFPLWDEHIQQAIFGVKIYRHSIVRQFAYRLDLPACEIHFNQQLQEAGYEWRTPPWAGPDNKTACIGRHGLHYTPATAYEAYFSRAVKSRLYPGLDWLRRLPALFVKLMRQEPDNPVHLYSLLGYVAGLNVGLATQQHDKDARIVDAAFVRIKEDLERT